MRKLNLLPVLFFGASLASAQTTQPSMPAASLIPQGFPDAGGTTPLQPVTFSLAPSVDGDYVPPTTFPANLFHEGQFLTHRDGKISRSPSGTLVFDPDAIGDLAEGYTIPTITVMPNRQYAAIESYLGNETSKRVTLSGELTAYNEQNYILADMAAPAGDATTKPDDDDATLAAAKVAPTTRPNPATMPAADLLDQMLTPAAMSSRPLPGVKTNPMDIRSGTSAVAPNGVQLDMKREGTFLVDRLGRLQRTPDNTEWEFVFEGDGKGMADPPVILLPNLKLMTMENSIRSNASDVRFRITGQLTEYNGRNYVLLDKVTIPADVSQRF